VVLTIIICYSGWPCANPSLPNVFNCLLIVDAYTYVKGKKGSPFSIASVGFWSWSRFFAVSLQLTWVINPAVGCRFFPPGPRIPSRPTVTWQLRGCDLNPGPSVPESSHLFIAFYVHFWQTLSLDWSMFPKCTKLRSNDSDLLTKSCLYQEVAVFIIAVCVCCRNTLFISF